MKIFSWDNILSFLNTGVQDPFFEGGTGISIGCFDGIHLGHRVLLKALIKECGDGLKSGVVTFARPLPSVKHSGDYNGDVSTLSRRLEIFEELGLDFAIVVDFDDSFASQLGADFLNILVNACNMEVLAEGVDFRCGYKGATDAQAIRYFGAKNGVKTVFVEPVYFREGTDEEERISSSFIREMVRKGFFATVGEMLGRPYDIDVSGVKKSGDGKGKFSVLRKDIVQVLPPDGVYLGFNEAGEDVRLVVSDGGLDFDVACKGKCELKRFLFK